jgi:hypothetical protein
MHESVTLAVIVENVYVLSYEVKLRTTCYICYDVRTTGYVMMS